MSTKVTHQIQNSKIQTRKMARLANFGLVIHPELGRSDEPLRIDLSLTPQFHVLQQSLEGTDTLAYEIKELIDQSQGSAGERHY